MPDNKQDLSEFTYSIKEAKENPLESMIEKSGVKVEFTLQQCKDHRAQLEKELKTLETTHMAHEAQIILLLNRHPEYADIHEADYMTCAAFCTKKMQNAEIADAIEKTKAAIKDYADEENHICSTLGIHVIDPKDLEVKPEEK